MKSTRKIRLFVCFPTFLRFLADVYAVGTGKNRGEEEKEIEWTDAPRGACHCFENAEEMKTCACLHTYHTHASARLHAHAHTQQRNETTHVRYVKHTQVLCLSHSINKYCRNMFLSSQRALQCDRCSLSIFISRPGEAMFGEAKPSTDASTHM